MGAKVAAVAFAVQLGAYRLLSRLSRVVPLPRKARESMAARRAAFQRWRAADWATKRAGRLIWFHAASVGEALTAEPVITRLRVALPGTGIVLTWSSPSVGRFPHRFGADVVDAAPPETGPGAAAVFAALRPDLLVVSRSDLWPEMLLAAHDRRVPVAVIAGSLREGSARLASPARQFYRELLRPIRFVGAVTEADAGRWVRMGVDQTAVAVTGDPRHDQSLERPTNLGPLQRLIRWSAAGPTLVAGSLEPADEKVVLEGLLAMRRAHPRARLLIVPHDPETAVIARLLRLSEQLGLPAEVLGGREPERPVVILSLRGVLADAYLLGGVSYVGGGFAERGLHAVIEPAVYGVPVIHGPFHSASPDADRLIEAGGAVALRQQAPGRDLGERWKCWVENEPARVAAGLAARTCLSQGAAAISARSLLSLLG